MIDLTDTEIETSSIMIEEMDSETSSMKGIMTSSRNVMNVKVKDIIQKNLYVTERINVCLI